jgi:hypothetical protein
MVDGGDQAPETGQGPPQEGGRPLVGYAVAGILVLILLIATIALLAGGTGGDDVASGGPDPDGDVVAVDREEDLLPDGGLFATPREGARVGAAAEAAGCDLQRFSVKTRDHIKRLDERVDYSSNPPTSGKHYPIPAADAAYEDAPNVKLLVHTLEHSRVIVWFQPDLPREARAALKAFYDHDSDRILLVPDATDMPYEVAASAWNGKPKPNGTGRLLGCPEYSDELFTALEAFKDRHRGRGPEPIP